MPESEIISMSEFARRLGVGEKTVRDAIKLGKIVSGTIMIKGKSKIIFDIALKEAESLGLMKLDRASQPVKGNLTEQASESINEDIASISGVSKNSTFAEAARLEKIFKARSAGIESQVLAGKFLEVDAVNFQLREFGVILKSKLENIPIQQTDLLISKASNREAFVKCLSQIIFNVLTDLSLTLKQK